MLGVPFTRVPGKKLKYQYVAMIKGVEAVKGELSALDKQLSLIFQREVSSYPDAVAGSRSRSLSWGFAKLGNMLRKICFPAIAAQMGKLGNICFASKICVREAKMFLT